MIIDEKPYEELTGLIFLEALRKALRDKGIDDRSKFWDSSPSIEEVRELVIKGLSNATTSRAEDKWL